MTDYDDALERLHEESLAEHNAELLRAGGYPRTQSGSSALNDPALDDQIEHPDQGTGPQEQSMRQPHTQRDDELTLIAEAARSIARRPYLSQVEEELAALIGRIAELLRETE